VFDVIQVKCDCGRVIKTNDENAGKKAKCPECGVIVQLPDATRLRKPKPKEDDEFEDLPVAEYSEDDDALPSARRKRKKVGSATNRGELDEESSSKKKKKGAKPLAQSPNKILIVGGIVGGVAILGIVVAVVMLVMSPGKTSATAANEAPAAAPKLPELENFSTAQGELTCLAPKGWEVKSGGGTGGIPPFATFEKGDIKIQFRSSPSGTQIGTISQAGTQNEEELPESMRPVSVVHAYQKEKFSLEVAGYEEKGEPKMFKLAGFGGEGRISTFTATEGMLGQAYGYRATLLGTNNQWNVVCRCPAAKWKVCQPLFMKILESASGN
jgi:hypothetical protein